MQYPRGRPKRISKLICNLAEIPDKIPTDPHNLIFDHYITHLKA